MSWESEEAFQDAGKGGGKDFKLGWGIYTPVVKCTKTALQCYSNICVFFKMVNTAYNNRTTISICICNKTADLSPDNAKDQNFIF